MHAMVDAIRFDPGANKSDRDFTKVQCQANDSRLPPIRPKTSKDMATESFHIELSADKDALTMQGEVECSMIYALVDW